MRKKIIAMIGIFIIFTFLTSMNKAYSKEKVLPFLSLSDYTGPSAGLNVIYDQFMKNYFEYLNEKGGIKGVKIKFIGVDTRYDLARTVSAYRRYRKMKGLISFHVTGSGMGRVVYPIANRDKISFVGSEAGHAVKMCGRWFARNQVYQDTFAGTLDWIVKDWKKKGNLGMPTVGYMGWDNDAGWAAMRGGKEYAEKIGVKLLKPEYYPPGSLDHSTYLLHLKGANYIYVESAEPEASNVIRDAYRLGMTKNIQFICDIWGPGMGWGVRVHNEDLQGLIIASSIIRGTLAQSHPLIKNFWAKFWPNESIRRLPYGGLVGLAIAMRYEAALKIALKEVGYEKLDKEIMYQAYQKLTGMDVTQGITGLCTYSPTERRPSKEIMLFQVKGKDVVPITDWFTPPDTLQLYKFD